MTLNDATLRQIEAADPGANTWLSANAGSGKTRVLTDRVARLLLKGVSPQNILCLTYTKAAASEMQNRLFKRLGAWAMKSDADLRAELDELGVTEVPDLRIARQLFARAIETPGGLKIQTIHSFCASILRRFPLEAGISPQFKEMDDRAARLLQADVIEDMADGAQRPLIEALARIYTGEDFARLTQEIAARRDAFAGEVDEDALWHELGLPPGYDEAALAADVLHPGDGRLIRDLLPFLDGSGANDQKAAAVLRLLPVDLGIGDLPALEGKLLTGSGAKAPFTPNDRFPAKAVKEKTAPHLMPDLDDLKERLAEGRAQRLRLYSARKTLILRRFAAPFVKEYEARKLARGWLDFDDLIRLAGQLLTDPAVAGWVLYRLDGGIDHILVDEAQDTSPTQWQVIESLAREFTTGESARENQERTIFVVGDQKQSIYSFQGADPAGFTRMRDTFDAAFNDVGRGVTALELEYSFRSSHAILSTVDLALEGAPGLGDHLLHRAFHADRPGRVDLWPAFTAEDGPEERDWHDPVDMPAPESPQVRLAEAMARQIEEMLETGTLPAENGQFRPITAGDIMVLVRGRSAIFHNVIRACKARGLPIAGADRLRIGAELAVKDMTAVLSFLATPEDDLSLAAALRSPLFGLSEDALYRLAQGRARQYLWPRLRASEHARAVEILSDLRREADFLRPYDLIDRLLTRHDGRRALIARLGAEAEDGIDALLSQALAYEQMDVPSLTGFLTWLEAEDVEIKRQMDSGGDQIRVMTVHGSKGLEAPIVFLPDCAKPRGNRTAQLMRMPEGGIAWRPPSGELPPELDAVDAARKEADREEWLRLLYVAMTRAESWLVVSAAGEVGDIGESWYQLVAEGVARAGAETAEFAAGTGKRLQHGAWGEATLTSDPPTEKTLILPDWAGEHAPHPPEPPKPLVPSDLGGAKIVGIDDSGEGDLETAMRRGRQIHRLLEFLPTYLRADWPATAEALLAFGEDAASRDEAAELAAEAARVLDAPELAQLFAPETLAEVSLSAPCDIAGRRRIHGTIDRLVVTAGSVLAVDFKTNAIVPDAPGDIPEGLLRQMGAYELALADIYPGKAIKSAILWTRTASLMECPPGLAQAALGRLDAQARRS